MQIKHQALAQLVQRKLTSVYVLIGQDNYLIEDGLSTIKSAIKSKYDCDEKMFSIQSADDWNIILDEANNYSLFADTVLLNINYDKKTLDAAGKKILTEYLSSINPRCFIIIRASNVPAKQLLWLSNQEQATVVTIYPLPPEGVKNWMSAQFKKNELNLAQQVIDLIFQYTQGNMLACAQVIEKIALSNPAHSLITAEQAMEHLSDQCDHSLFELVEACLHGNAGKTIQILRQAANNKTESTLVLWMLTQEVRMLIQLSALASQIDFKTACSQLKIWPQRTNLYQLAYKRLNTAFLEQLLSYCRTIDEQIKSSLNNQVWNALEKLSLSLCLGQSAGDLCTV